MTDDPVSLDGHRSAAGKIATDIRRHALQDFEADRQALLWRQEELESPGGNLERGRCEGAVSDPALCADRGGPGRPGGRS